MIKHPRYKIRTKAKIEHDTFILDLIDKYRGLYVCSECGTKINADVNGSYNIMKKAFPKMINMDGIQGVRLHLLLINLDTKSRSMSMKTSQTRRNLE